MCCGEKRNVLITENTLSGRGGIGVFDAVPGTVENRNFLIGDNPWIEGTEFDAIVFKGAPGAFFTTTTNSNIVIQRNGSVEGGGFGILVCATSGFAGCGGTNRAITIRNNGFVVGETAIRLEGSSNQAVSITSNRFVIGFSGIEFSGSVSPDSGNAIIFNGVFGFSIGTGTGIGLQAADGISIVFNQVDNFMIGIAVQDGSSDNAVIRNFIEDTGVYDIFWDGSGSGNRFIANDCDTSQPFNLCTGN